FTNFGPTNIPGRIQITGGTLNLGGSWSNFAGDPSLAASTIELISGNLKLGGSFTTAAVGTLNRSGGLVALTGALNNTGAILALNDVTGSWRAESGSITGGTIAATGEAQITQPFGSFALVNVTELNAP